MEFLSNTDKVVLARQFNLIVRAINDYQISNWAKIDERDFNELIKKEREILSFVEQLLESSSPIQMNQLSSLVVDLECLSKDLRQHLKSSKLSKSSNLISDISA